VVRTGPAYDRPAMGDASASSPTAVVVDGWALLRLGVGTVLTAEGIVVVGDCSTLEEALAVVRDRRPSVFVAGWPSGSTVSDAIRRVRSLPSPPTVLALVPHGDRAALAEIVQLGPDAVLDRAADADELHDAVRRLLRGERVVATSLHSALLQSLTVGPARQAAAVADLTAREREVLGLLARNQTNRQIAAAMFVTPGTVKTHVTRIFTKLGVKTRAEAVARAVELRVLE
jgi:DNA-binding NarL/FixJ family response regulator